MNKKILLILILVITLIDLRGIHSTVYYYDEDTEDPREYMGGFVFLQPGYPIIFIGLDGDDESLEYYKEQFLLDLRFHL